MANQSDEETNTRSTFQFDKVYILDTNIILNDAKNIFKIMEDGKNLVVLPETTLDEIDSKKSGFNEINFQAREFARILSNAEILNSRMVDDLTITTVSLAPNSNRILEIISKDKYDIDKDTERNIVNDRRILVVAEACKKIYNDSVSGKQENIIFLSLDVMARTRAISYNLFTEPLLEKDGTLVDKEYVKSFEVSPAQLAELNNKPIIEVDENYKVENYSYYFKSSDGNSALSVIENGIIHFIDEESFEKNPIRPVNLEQRFAMDALLNRNFNVILIEALAGTGKTLISIAAALKLVKEKKYEKITYIRNSIESVDKGEDVGYLSGNEEKFKIYTYPLYDTLAMVARAKNKDIDLQTEQQIVGDMVDKYNIETPWVGEIRGRTITNSVVILDEAQNMSKKTMQTVISRLDKTCKLIIIGSNKQIDNQYVNKYTNGLASIIKASGMKSDEVNMFATKLTKVVRGPITAWAEKVFED